MTFAFPPPPCQNLSHVLLANNMVWVCLAASWSSQAAEPLFLVHFLKESLAKFIGADHDGTGGSHLDDARQET